MFAPGMFAGSEAPTSKGRTTKLQFPDIPDLEGYEADLKDGWAWLGPHLGPRVRNNIERELRRRGFGRAPARGAPGGNGGGGGFPPDGPHWRPDAESVASTDTGSSSSEFDDNSSLSTSLFEGSDISSDPGSWPRGSSSSSESSSLLPYEEFALSVLGSSSSESGSDHEEDDVQSDAASVGSNGSTRSIRSQLHSDVESVISVAISAIVSGDDADSEYSSATSNNSSRRPGSDISSWLDSGSEYGYDSELEHKHSDDEDDNGDDAPRLPRDVISISSTNSDDEDDSVGAQPAPAPGPGRGPDELSPADRLYTDMATAMGKDRDFPYTKKPTMFVECRKFKGVLYPVFSSPDETSFYRQDGTTVLVPFLRRVRDALNLSRSDVDANAQFLSRGYHFAEQKDLWQRNDRPGRPMRGNKLGDQFFVTGKSGLNVTRFVGNIKYGGRMWYFVVYQNGSPDPSPTNTEFSEEKDADPLATPGNDTPQESIYRRVLEDNGKFGIEHLRRYRPSNYVRGRQRRSDGKYYPVFGKWLDDPRFDGDDSFFPERFWKDVEKMKETYPGVRLDVVDQTYLWGETADYRDSDGSIATDEFTMPGDKFYIEEGDGIYTLQKVYGTATYRTSDGSVYPVAIYGKDDGNAGVEIACYRCVRGVKSLLLSGIGAVTTTAAMKYLYEAYLAYNTASVVTDPQTVANAVGLSFSRYLRANVASAVAFLSGARHLGTAAGMAVAFVGNMFVFTETENANNPFNYPPPDANGNIPDYFTNSVAQTIRLYASTLTHTNPYPRCLGYECDSDPAGPDEAPPDGRARPFMEFLNSTFGKGGYVVIGGAKTVSVPTGFRRVLLDDAETCARISWAFRNASGSDTPPRNPQNTTELQQRLDMVSTVVPELRRHRIDGTHAASHLALPLPSTGVFRAAGLDRDRILKTTALFCGYPEDCLRTLRTVLHSYNIHLAVESGVMTKQQAIQTALVTFTGSVASQMGESEMLYYSALFEAMGGHETFYNRSHHGSTRRWSAAEIARVMARLTSNVGSMSQASVAAALARRAGVPVPETAEQMIAEVFLADSGKEVFGGAHYTDKPTASDPAFPLANEASRLWIDQFLAIPTGLGLVDPDFSRRRWMAQQLGRPTGFPLVSYDDYEHLPFANVQSQIQLIPMLYKAATPEGMRELACSTNPLARRMEDLVSVFEFFINTPPTQGELQFAIDMDQRFIHPHAPMREQLGAMVSTDFAVGFGAALSMTRAGSTGIAAMFNSRMIEMGTQLGVGVMFSNLHFVKWLLDFTAKAASGPAGGAAAVAIAASSLSSESVVQIGKDGMFISVEKGGLRLLSIAITHSAVSAFLPFAGTGAAMAVIASATPIVEKVAEKTIEMATDRAKRAADAAGEMIVDAKKETSRVFDLGAFMSAYAHIAEYAPNRESTMISSALGPAFRAADAPVRQSRVTYEDVNDARERMESQQREQFERELEQEAPTTIVVKRSRDARRVIEELREGAKSRSGGWWERITRDFHHHVKVGAGEVPDEPNSSFWGALRGTASMLKTRAAGIIRRTANRVVRDPNLEGPYYRRVKETNNINQFMDTVTSEDFKTYIHQQVLVDQSAEQTSTALIDLYVLMRDRFAFYLENTEYRRTADEWFAQLWDQLFIEGAAEYKTRRGAPRVQEMHEIPNQSDMSRRDDDWEYDPRSIGERRWPAHELPGYNTNPEDGSGARQYPWPTGMHKRHTTTGTGGRRIRLRAKSRRRAAKVGAGLVAMLGLGGLHAHVATEARARAKKQETKCKADARSRSWRSRSRGGNPVSCKASTACKAPEPSRGFAGSKSLFSKHLRRLEEKRRAKFRKPYAPLPALPEHLRVHR